MQDKGVFIGKVLNRREFLKKSGMTALAFGGGLELFTACATTDSKPRWLSAVLNASEQRDRAIDNMFQVNLTVKKHEKVLVFTDDHKPVITQEAEYIAKRGAKLGDIF